ncbi:MAG: zinc ABC transporter substrate-binding protein [Phycisphaerales bacterium]
MSVRALLAILVVLVAHSSAAGPTASPPPAAPGGRAAMRPVAAVSIPPQRWLVRRLAGDAVDTIVVVEPSASHETYQPTDKQASDVMRADVYFAIGLPLERSRWFEAVRSRVRVVDCAAGIAPRTLEAHAHGDDDDHGPHSGAATGEGASHDAPGDHVGAGDGRDPHIWTTPATLKAQARTMAAVIADLLAATSGEPMAAPTTAPAGDAPREPAREGVRAQVRERLAALERELDELDASLRATLAPCRGRAMFVFHPAWGYFADAYGLRQVAIEHEGKAPTDHELTALQRLARAEGVDVVFVQPQISSKAADAVAAAVDGRVERIDPMAEDVPANLRKVAEAVARGCKAGARSP